MAFDLKKSIKGLTFFTRSLPFFGGKMNDGDQFVFDQRGAIRISTMEHTKKNGEVVNIRGVVEAGRGKSFTPGDSMVISRPSSSSVGIDSGKAMDAYRNWPFAAIKPIADEIAGIEWRFFKTNRNGERQEVQDHDLIDFLETVNDFQTAPEFKYTLAAHLELTGNAYILLEGVKDFMSRPTAMYLLDPSAVMVNIDRTTYPYKITGYKFTLDGKERKYQPHEIIHIKNPNPSNPYVGVGTVQAIAEWIDNDNNATEFLRQFFKNGAQVGVTLETDMTSEEQMQSLKDSFEEQHAGVSNAYKAMILPKGVKKSKDDVSFNDIGFDQISDTTRDKILAGFRVPKTIIGAAESDTNRATAETADYVFARRTIKPKLIMICSYFNEFLVPRFANDIVMTFEDPVTEDEVSKSNLMKNAVSGLPVLTQNEAREDYLGLDPVDGGDTLLIPNNYKLATQAGEVSDPFMLSAKKKATTDTVEKVRKNRKKVGYMPARMRRAKSQFSRNVEIRQEISKSLADKITDALLAMKKKSLKEMDDHEYDEVILKAKRDRIGSATKQTVDALQKLNNAQEKEVLENLERAIKANKKEITASQLFNLKHWISLTIDGVSTIGKGLMALEAEHALEMIDRAGIDVANSPNAIKALEKALSLMAKSYNQNTLDMLKQKLNEGLERGLGPRDLGDIVRNIYEFKNVYAAERVAQTEMNRIANMSSKMAWQQSGVVKEVKWVTSSRDNVCEFCADMEGEIIEIDKDFFSKGDRYEVGDSVMDMDYSDIGGPPLHPNCHCGIRPIVDTTIEASIREAEKKQLEDAEAEKAIKELENE